MSFIPQFVPKTLFDNEQLTTAPSTVIDGSVAFRNSFYHDISSSNPVSASIKLSGTHLVFSVVTASFSVAASLETKKRVMCAAGQHVESSFSLQFPSVPSIGSTANWGLITDSNGYGAYYDWISPGVFYRSGSVDTQIRTGSWNVDRLDGTGPSGKVLNFQSGTTSIITYSGHGIGGTVEFAFLDPSPGSAAAKPIVVHRLNLQDIAARPPTVSLPLRIEAHNEADGNPSGTTFTFNLLDRRAISYGAQQNRYRLIPCELTGAYGGTGQLLQTNAWTNLGTVALKSGDHPNVVLHSVELVADNPAQFQVKYGSPASFSVNYNTPLSCSNNECFSTTGSSGAGGGGGGTLDPEFFLIDMGFIGFSGAPVHRNANFGDSIVLSNTTTSDVIVVLARRLTSSGTNVYGVVTMKEYW